MRHVAYFITFAQADDVRKVVLDDAEVILVVRDVRWERESVAAADDALLAEVGRQPVHFQRELVGANDLGRIGESLTDLREEGEVAVRGGAVVAQRGIRQLLRAPFRCALDELSRTRIVPRLRSHRLRDRADQGGPTRGSQYREDSAHE